MIPAPLPSEEIERLKTRMRSPFDSGCNCNVDMINPWFHDTLCRRRLLRHTIPALLAEIDAGRAGAERVQELEEAAESLVGDEADPVSATLIRNLRAEIAALRQAAQPSELERLRNEIASLRASLGQQADRPAEPIGCPAPGACSCPSAQPPGRVEDDELVRRVEDVLNETILGDLGSVTPLAESIYREFSMTGRLLSATPPASGAVDSGENGR